MIGGVLAATAQVQAQQPATPQFNKATLAAGESLYHGVGGCVPCHGPKGAGTVDGPSLTDEPWTLGDGSFEWLLHITRHAGWGARGRDGEPQRMRGPTVLDSTQVRRVAAYVFSISRSKAPAPVKSGP
jgi:mono/diheme cytochrome c family protein